MKFTNRNLNMTGHQQITIKDETFVLVPLPEYLTYFQENDAAEEAWAQRALADHRAAVSAGNDLTMPLDQWDRIDAGESPIKVIREYRNMTQTELAEKSGIARPEISAIEAGKRRGTVDTLKCLAKALRTSLDTIVGD